MLGGLFGLFGKVKIDKIEVCWGTTAQPAGGPSCKKMGYFGFHQLRVLREFVDKIGWSKNNLFSAR